MGGEGSGNPKILGARVHNSSIKILYEHLIGTTSWDLKIYETTDYLVFGTQIHVE